LRGEFDGGEPNRISAVVPAALDARTLSSPVNGDRS
jgi:hypothetical protein